MTCSKCGNSALSVALNGAAYCHACYDWKAERLLRDTMRRNEEIHRAWVNVEHVPVPVYRHVEVRGISTCGGAVMRVTHWRDLTIDKG